MNGELRTLELDVATWRCGSDYDCCLGHGATRLCNTEGFMCCLGQFAMQAGASPHDLGLCSQPSMISPEVVGGMRPWYAKAFIGRFGMDSRLTISLMRINDGLMSPTQKVEVMALVLSSHDFRLRVINWPTHLPLPDFSYQVGEVLYAPEPLDVGCSPDAGL